MNVLPTRLPGVLLLEPAVYRDDRGWFLETWQDERYAASGIAGEFVQDNLSFSKRGVLRGLHYQNPSPQGKLVSVPHGEVWDVAVDLRTDSPTYRQWTGTELSAENARQVWIPAGFAHGYVVLSETAVVAYKCTAFYCPGTEHGLLWNDPELGIEWPVAEPVLSARDAAAPLLCHTPPEDLFTIASST